MLPPDVASSLRLVQPDSQSVTNAQNQPVASSQKIADVLSNLVPGQRVLAEIQALLPNGSYRALVAQRDVTLALPFSAKAGDTLELEVTESDGKLALAFVANRSESAAKSSLESVPTTLSPTGKMIGDLMGGIEGEGKRAHPQRSMAASRWSNHAETAADLAPVSSRHSPRAACFTRRTRRAGWPGAIHRRLEKRTARHYLPQMNAAGSEATTAKSARNHSRRCSRLIAHRNDGRQPRPPRTSPWYTATGWLGHQNFAGRVKSGRAADAGEIGGNPDDSRSTGNERCSAGKPASSSPCLNSATSRWPQPEERKQRRHHA